MKPIVFISSTVKDLHAHREALGKALADLGYEPVMSERGDIGYLGNRTVEDSCYHSIEDCQIVIVIIGKRYGSVSSCGKSVTHNEFCRARDKRIPTITFVDRDVLTLKETYDAQECVGKVSLPGLENAEGIFAFIDDVSSTDELNNAIIPFSTCADLEGLLRKQLADLFYRLLRGHFDPIKVQVADIISLVQGLRNEMNKQEKDERFILAMRFLIDDSNSEFKHFVEEAIGPLDVAVSLLLRSDSFDAFLRDNGFTVENVPLDGKGGHEEMGKHFLEHNADVIDGEGRPIGVHMWTCGMGDMAFYRIDPNKRLRVNNAAYRVLDVKYRKMLETVAHLRTV